jgi:hypothetical protein
VLQLTDVDGISLQPVIPDNTEYDMVVVDGTSVPTKPSLTGDSYNTLTIYRDYSNGAWLSHSVSEGVNGTVDLALTNYGRDTRVQGSQYVFMSYMQSGSGTTISAPYQFTSSRYDYHECLPPVIQTGRYSEVSNVSANIYDVDIYGGKAFTDWTAYGFGATSTSETFFINKASLQTNNWTANYGLDFESLTINSSTIDPLNGVYYWSLNSANGLRYRSTPATGSATIKIPAFFYKANDPSTWNYLYQVTVSTDLAVADTAQLRLFYGNLSSGLSSVINPTTTDTSVTFTTKATGTWLYLVFDYTSTGPTGTDLQIKKLQVKCLNYRADVQDFHLRDSYGMRNARYDGSKLTSADWNINSPDTTDGGPVVTVTVGGGTQLSVEQNVRGTFRTI